MLCVLSFFLLYFFCVTSRPTSAHHSKEEVRRRRALEAGIVVAHCSERLAHLDRGAGFS